MNYNSIKLLINSFSKPYGGSILIIENEILRVSKISKIMQENMPATKMLKISININSIKIQNNKANNKKNS